MRALASGSGVGVMTVAAESVSPSSVCGLSSTSAGALTSSGDGSANTHRWPSCTSQRPVRALIIQRLPSTSTTRNWATCMRKSSSTSSPRTSCSSSSRYFCSASIKRIRCTSSTSPGRASAHYNTSSIAIQTRRRGQWAANSPVLPGPAFIPRASRQRQSMS